MEEVYVIPQNLKEKKQPVVFTAKDWLCLLLALGLAILYRNVFSLDRLTGFGPPGLGVTVYVFALFAVVCFALGKRLRLNVQSAALSLCALLLSLCCFLHGNPFMTILNCFVILAVGAMAVFSLSGVSARSWRDARILPETAVNAARALFTRVAMPFRALSGLTKNRRTLLGALVGVLICVPVLAIVLVLLISADTVFASLLRGFTDWLAAQNVLSLLWRGVETLVIAFLLASALYFLRAGGKKDGAAIAKRAGAAILPSAPFVAALILLDLVYALFVGVQFVVLFGGTEVAALRGGYAEYARGGFFQLVWVAVINLAAVLLSAALCFRPKAQGDPPSGNPARPGRLALRVCAGILLALTAVILVSALRRMSLYISVYGLSFLRILTLWAMAVIAVCLVAAAVKLVRPSFRFFQVFLAFTLCSWIVFNCLNVDALAADYNVDAYLSGSVQQVDAAYLASLSPDTYPALLRLYAQTDGRMGYSTEQLKDMSVTDRPWTALRLSDRNVPG